MLASVFILYSSLESLRYNILWSVLEGISSELCCFHEDWFSLVFFVFFSDPNMPNIDLAFAISATSANSNQSYNLMKNTIKKFIDQYGVDKIHYSLIVYGDSIVRVVNFNHTFPPSAIDLKAAIDAQPAISGGPYLEGALQEAFKVFNETEGRPDAKKVLVVMTDENSGTDENSLSTAVKPVEDLGVLVLSVGAGSAVDRNELSVISPNPLDVISPALGENPSVVADRIMERILRRKT